MARRGRSAASASGWAGGAAARDRAAVTLNAAAWRRLDRISAIVLDSPVRCSDRPQVLSAEPASSMSMAEIWRAASGGLHEQSIVDLATEGPWTSGEIRLQRDPDPVAGGGEGPGAERLLVRRGDQLLGRVTVGSELEPLADAVLDAARATGARVLRTRRASVAEVLPRADEVLMGGDSLVDDVLRLQAEGHAVLVVSDAADRARRR